jgi:cell division septation protein DedD
VRDSQKIKDKYELALDNRQVVSLFIAGIVVMGTVFVLGVVVGKNLAGSQRPGGTADLFSALDQKAAAMEQVRAETRLTFQDELTKKSVAEPSRLPQTSPAGGDPEASQVPRPNSTSQPAASKTGMPIAPPHSQATDALREVKMDALPQPPEVSRGEVAAKPPRPPSSDPPLSSRPAPAPPPASRHKQSLTDAIARVERPADRGTRQKSTGPESTGSFTLQLSASQVREDADRFAAKVREKGYQVYVIQSDVAGRGRWYRVRLGKFPTQEAAARYLKDFRRETHLSAFLTRTDES